MTDMVSYLVSGVVLGVVWLAFTIAAVRATYISRARKMVGVAIVTSIVAFGLIGVHISLKRNEVRARTHCTCTVDPVQGEEQDDD